MFDELDSVALRHDLPAHGLRVDDVGVIVLVHGEKEAFEVEFVARSGRTVALLTLDRTDVRAVGETEEVVSRALTQADAA